MDGALPLHARVVIVGGGIVGCATAFHLTKLGWSDVVVLDQGPLFENWGSSSHAPGMMFQHNVSKTVCQLAMWSVETYKELRPADGPAFFQVGSMEIASTPERWEELKRRAGQCRSWGLEASLLGPEEAGRLFPIMVTADLYGALSVPSDCVVKPSSICAEMAKLASRRGASFHAETPVTGIEVERGRVRAVVTPRGSIATAIVVSAAGMWGPLIGRMAGVELPLVPMRHIFARTGSLPELAGETAFIRFPLLRDQDRDMYFRQYADAVGFGSYGHDPLTVKPEDLPHPSMLPCTPDQFEAALRNACERIPTLRRASITDQFNGLFSFTSDGQSLLGESPDVRGFWSAEAVWITHAGGVGKVMAEWIVEGAPSIDLREVDLNRFQPHALGLGYVKARAKQAYVEVYDIIHPLQQMEFPRPLRVSPFHQRQRDLGACFFENAGWERPQWFQSNEKLLEGGHSWSARSGWTARHWSPVIGAEHRAVRERVGLFDLTPFGKLDVSGPSAYDMARNEGWVNVGLDHDTATFAVESIRRWWTKAGRARYPQTCRLLITADGGGSNGSRLRLWKWELQRLADETGLQITVCHYPPGTSNTRQRVPDKIEHRLFAFISQNWRGRPLVSSAVILSLIAATTTATGLTVESYLDTNPYPTGVTPTDAQMATLHLRRAAFHGEWNYTIAPRPIGFAPVIV